MFDKTVTSSKALTYFTENIEVENSFLKSL